MKILTIAAIALSALTQRIHAQTYVTAGFDLSPYEFQVRQQLGLLKAKSPKERAAAVEALGYLRAYVAADSIATLLDGSDAVVRREAAMSLGWCGGRTHVDALLRALDDEDWTVRQAAWVALTNLTGMEFPFDGLGAESKRIPQTTRWRNWWKGLPKNVPPPEVLALLPGSVTASTIPPPSSHPQVSALSSTYKGSAEILTDGKIGPDFWQTKNVAFPQYCTIDLGTVQEIGCVVVHQHQIEAMHMADYSILGSADGKSYKEICRRKGKTPQTVTVTFPVQETRFIRIASHGTGNPTYPTTWYEVEVLNKAGKSLVPVSASATASVNWKTERGLRALGCLGGKGATKIVAGAMSRYTTQKTSDAAIKTLIQAGIRALGRLKGPEALPLLIQFLGNPQWAHYAADALGDHGGDKAAQALLAIYPKYAMTLTHGRPPTIPPPDYPRLSPIDRQYVIPFTIISALCRLPLDNPQTLKKLRELGPLIAANVPGDFDGAILYEPESHQLIAAYLLERAGLRQLACDAALQGVGVDRKLPATPQAEQMKKAVGNLTSVGKHRNDTPFAATWIPVFCREKQDVPVLIRLLEHENGWVRMNAAKALMFMQARKSAPPMVRILAESKTETDYGYFGGFLYNTRVQGQDEYNDQCPRWREAYARGLGILGVKSAVPLLIKLMNDERNTVGIQHAASLALDRLGTAAAIAALKDAQTVHPYHTVRLVAAEALWRRGVAPATPLGAPVPKTPPPIRIPENAELTSLVFIKGNHQMPNTFQIDQWRQVYSTTDTGPTYRLGNNLYTLSPAAPDGVVTALTNFTEGYVSDCEVSWDGKRVIFSRRGGNTDPWWHVYEVNADGSNLRQITDGPYHDVQPAYLPDDRIIFSSSRVGMRDEYHGYLATGLTVMNPDGSDIHCIGFNLGRDGEPSILGDGRVLFSRLELFYSRMKTEWNVEAAFPDGTRCVTLYGPERRHFWKNITRRSGEGGWGESGPRHRTLRIVQPQPFDEGRQLCATTGGLTLVGQGRFTESRIPHDQKMAVTSPFPLGGDQILCAAGPKKFKGRSWLPTDLGLYIVDAQTGSMTLIYDDPETADFEPRPLSPRRRPPILAEGPLARSTTYTGRLLCNSAKFSQEARVGQRGRFVRIVEGQPVITRHQTHTTKHGFAWKNHVGTHARVLGTVPLASDGSFFLEIPADRLVHCQVLDSDRRVVGNQQIWMYARPGETKGCVGCHEKPDSAPVNATFPAAARSTPIPCLPTGGEFSYRAKFWNKGTLTDEGEERTRTARAVNLLGRQ